MTDVQNTLGEDIAYLKTLAEEGRAAPVLAGPYMALGGGLFGVTSLLAYAIQAGFLPLPPQALGWIWPASGLAFVFALPFLNRRTRSRMGSASTLNETIGRAVTLQQQQAVRRAYQTGFKAFMEEKDPTNRVAIALATEVECANSGAEGEAKAILSIYAGAATNAAPLDAAAVARPVPAKPPAPVDAAAPGEPIKPAGN